MNPYNIGGRGSTLNSSEFIQVKGMRRERAARWSIKEEESSGTRANCQEINKKNRMLWFFKKTPVCSLQSKTCKLHDMKSCFPLVYKLMVPPQVHHISKT